MIPWCIFCALSSLYGTPPLGTTVPLSAPQGFPLRLVLTRRLRFRRDEPVHARLVDSVFAFDREVAPPGAEVLGHIQALDGVGKRKRALAMLGGDFTPLREPRLGFDSLLLPGGKSLALDTAVSPGSGLVVRFDGKAKRKGRVGTAADAARQQIEARKQAVIDAVRTPGRMRRLEDMLLARLPYHPQSLPAGSRFDAKLLRPVAFGGGAVPAGETDAIGAQPPPDSVVYARLLSELDSHTAVQGMAVTARLSRPLFAPDHRLLYPEGSLLRGVVTQARPARFWHRGGQLRFLFQEIEPPAGLYPAPAGTVQTRVEGRLESVEVAGQEKLQMDAEGGTRVPSSKKRFLFPVLTTWIAGRGMDNDPVRVHGVATGARRANRGGRGLAGLVGLGLPGAALAQLSRPFGAALGWYGAGWSIYNNLIARGREVRFPIDTPVEIRFGTR